MTLESDMWRRAHKGMLQLIAQRAAQYMERLEAHHGHQGGSAAAPARPKQ